MDNKEINNKIINKMKAWSGAPQHPYHVVILLGLFFKRAPLDAFFLKP